MSNPNKGGSLRKLKLYKLTWSWTKRRWHTTSESHHIEIFKISNTRWGDCRKPIFYESSFSKLSFYNLRVWLEYIDKTLWKMFIGQITACSKITWEDDSTITALVQGSSTKFNRGQMFIHEFIHAVLYNRVLPENQSKRKFAAKSSKSAMFFFYNLPLKLHKLLLSIKTTEKANSRTSRLAKGSLYLPTKIKNDYHNQECQNNRSRTYLK